MEDNKLSKMIEEVIKKNMPKIVASIKDGTNDILLIENEYVEILETNEEIRYKLSLEMKININKLIRIINGRCDKPIETGIILGVFSNNVYSLHAVELLKHQKYEELADWIIANNGGGLAGNIGLV